MPTMKRASKSKTAERDRERAPSAYMVRGRKMPRDRDDETYSDSSRSRSASDDSRTRTRGFAATASKKRPPAKSAALEKVRKETSRVRADLDREASRALPAARRRDGAAAKSARAALAARRTRTGDAGRLLATDTLKPRRRGASDDDEKPRRGGGRRRGSDDDDDAIGDEGDDVVLGGLRRAKELDDEDVGRGSRKPDDRRRARADDSDVWANKGRAKSRADDSDVWGDKSRAKSRADDSDVWADKSRAKSRADDSDVWGDKSRAKSEDEDAFKARPKTTTWRVRDVEDDGNTTITSARGMDARDLDEARAELNGIVAAARDGGRSPVPFGNTRPPDDVAEAFDQLKTENAALRHELAQSLKAADILAAGGARGGILAQSLADGDAPNRALEVSQRSVEGALVQGAGPPTRRGLSLFDTVRRVQRGCAPVCAVSAERTMVPERGPRVSVWGAHEKAVASAIEDRISRTQSLDCVSRLRAAVSRVNERDGYTTVQRIYGAFRDAGFMTLTPGDVEDLCGGLSLDQRGRVDVGELLRLCVDVADECAESLLGAGDLVTRFGPRLGGPPEGWSGDKRDDRHDEKSDAEDDERRRRRSRSRRRSSRSRSGSGSRSPRRSRRDKDRQSRSHSGSRDRKRSSRRGEDRKRSSSRRGVDGKRSSSRRGEDALYAKVRAKRDGSRRRRDASDSPRSRRGDRDRDDSPRSRRTASSRVLAKRDRSVKGRDGYPVGKGRRDPRDRKRRDDDSDSHDDRSRQDRDKSRRRRDDDSTTIESRRDKSRRRPKDDDSVDEKSRRRDGSRVKRRGDDDSVDAKSRRCDRSRAKRRGDDSVDARSRRRRDDDSTMNGTARRRKDDASDEDKRRPARDTNRRVTKTIVDTVKRQSKDDGLRSPRDAFARSLRRLFEDMDVNEDGVLSKREIRAALLDLGKRDKENAFLKPKELRDLFGEMDLNGDGKVSYDELVDFLVDHVAGATLKKGRDASPRTAKRATKELGFAKALRRHFEDADADGSGDLSKREVRDALVSFARKDRSGAFPKKEALRALFEDLDLNGDGYVSYDELCEFIEARVARPRSPARRAASRRHEDENEKADPQVTFAKALKKHFDDLDKSGDGDLSKKEVKRALAAFAKKDRKGAYPKLKELAAIFSSLDLDGDGYVSYDEICEYIDDDGPESEDPRRAFARALKAHFEKLDKSGDDDLSKKEVKAALIAFTKKDKSGKFPKLKELADIFRDLDLNGDGHVSYDELSEFIADVGAGRDTRRADASADGKKARRASPRKADAQATFAQALKKHFDDLDKSGDGDLSKKEVKQALTSFAKKDRKGAYPKLKELNAVFEALDLDCDGHVSYDELCEFIDERLDGAPEKADPRATLAQALKKHFDDLDKSGDGDLSKREVKQALTTFAKKDKKGKFPKLKELAAIFDDMDLDGDGHVSYEEICDYIDERLDKDTSPKKASRRREDGSGDEGSRRARSPQKADPRATFAKALKQHFDDLDKSGDDDLSKREVKQALQAFSKKDKKGQYPKLKELAALFEDMDLDGDEHLSYEEICDYIDERVGPSERDAADPRATFAKALKRHFDDLDKSGDGDLSKKEVKEALRSFAKKDRSGTYPKLRELNALFDAMGLDGDGHVSYDEVCEYIDERVAGGEEPRRSTPKDAKTTFAKALKTHFDDLDKSGDGDLSKREVKAALASFAKKDKKGAYPKLKELASLFEDMDLDGDSHVSYDEVCDYIDDRAGDAKSDEDADDDGSADDDDASRGSRDSCLTAGEAQALLKTLQRSASDGRVPMGALLKAAPRRCEKKLRHLAQAAQPGSASQRKRLGRTACRLRKALTHRAKPSAGSGKVDLRELEDAEPELFEEGTLACFRDCCARLAGCSEKDADALFRLVDDDRDGVLGRREIIEFVRDSGESWSRRAGLDAAALDISPRSDGDVSAQYSDEDDDDRSVAFEPLVKQLLGTTSTKKKSAPHLRAVASRIAGALVEDRDGDYDEGHAGKARQGFLTRNLYDALEKEERRKGQGVAWDSLKKELERRGVIRALSSRDLELLRDEYSEDGHLVRDWRNLLKIVDEAAGEAPDASPRSQDATVARSAAQQLLDAAARGERKGSDSDSEEGDRDNFIQSLKDLFADMDEDGDGVLTKREVRDKLGDLGERSNTPGLRPHQVQKLFDAIDGDGDGEVTYEELVDFLVEQTEAM